MQYLRNFCPTGGVAPYGKAHGYAGAPPLHPGRSFAPAPHGKCSRGVGAESAAQILAARVADDYS